MLFTHVIALSPKFFQRSIEIVLRFRWRFYHENPYPNRPSVWIWMSLPSPKRTKSQTIRFGSFDDCVYRYIYLCMYLICNDEAKCLADGSRLQLLSMFNRIDRTPMNFSIFHKIELLIMVERAFLRLKSYPHAQFVVFVSSI